MQNFIKVYKTKPKYKEMQWSKKTPREIAGQKDRQTLFHRTLPAAPGGLKSTTMVDWHLKVKDTHYDFDLTKKLLNHSQHAKNNQLNLYSHSQDTADFRVL